MDPTALQTLSAPELVLTLADSVPEPRLAAAQVVAAAQLLGIDAGAVRVALARLVKQGVLEQAERGVYRLGRRGSELHRRVLAWDRVEDQVRRWDGRWLAVLTAQLGRSDKAGLRARERALRLKGFAEAQPGLFVRPNNLRAALPALRDELVGLGLDREALVVVIDQADPTRPFEPERLWDTAALERRYADDRRRLEESTARVAELDVQSAARETLLVGRAVMHDILIDPLLPETLVDVAARRRLIAAMRAYDRLGKRCWRAFYRALPP
ncbi:MAG TPA: type IV toxin-antitoxin system AbiEi family antitoxin domain-containing protein [Pseudomonadales bacterium]